MLNSFIFLIHMVVIPTNFLSSTVLQYSMLMSNLFLSTSINKVHVLHLLNSTIMKSVRKARLTNPASISINRHDQQRSDQASTSTDEPKIRSTLLKSLSHTTITQNYPLPRQNLHSFDMLKKNNRPLTILLSSMSHSETLYI